MSDGLGENLMSHGIGLVVGVIAGGIVYSTVTTAGLPAPLSLIAGVVPIAYFGRLTINASKVGR